MLKTYWIAFKTIVIKEVNRFMRIWAQTLLPPAITMTLYFVIFGNLIGKRIGLIDGVSYMTYITPGLIMMSVITNAYSNVSSSFFSTKFMRNVEEMLVAPVPSVVILFGFVTGGVVRALITGLIVAAIALGFSRITIQHYFITISVVILSAILFSVAGFINALFAKKFDDVSIIPTFVLTPLTYLGGVFYSIKLLPAIWQDISLANPILYLVNAFRYGFINITDVNIVAAFTFLFLFIILLFIIALGLLHKGTGIRS